MTKHLLLDEPPPDTANRFTLIATQFLLNPTVGKSAQRVPVVSAGIRNAFAGVGDGEASVTGGGSAIAGAETSGSAGSSPSGGRNGRGAPSGAGASAARRARSRRSTSARTARSTARPGSSVPAAGNAAR